MKRTAALLLAIVSVLCAAITLLVLTDLLRVPIASRLYRLVWLVVIEILFVNLFGVYLLHRKFHGPLKLVSLVVIGLLAAGQCAILFLTPPTISVAGPFAVRQVNLLLGIAGVECILFVTIASAVTELPLGFMLPAICLLTTGVTYGMFHFALPVRDPANLRLLIYALAAELLFVPLLAVALSHGRLKDKHRRATVLSVCLFFCIETACLILIPLLRGVKAMTGPLASVMVALFGAELLVFFFLFFRGRPVRPGVSSAVLSGVGLATAAGLYAVLTKVWTRAVWLQLALVVALGLVFLSTTSYVLLKKKLPTGRKAVAFIVSVVCLAAGLSALFTAQWLAPRLPGVPYFWPTLGVCVLLPVAVTIVFGRIKTERRTRRKTSAKKAPQPPLKPPFEPYAGSKDYIFVSYSHRNMAEVFTIIHQLYKSGFNIWYDKGIEPGKEWPEVVGGAISKCSRFLVFISSDSVRSRNVRNEVNYAFTARKKMMVVYLTRTPLTSGLALQIGTVQSIMKHELSDVAFYATLRKSLA